MGRNTGSVLSQREDDLRDDKWTVKINGPYLDVGIGTVVPLESPRGLNSLNTSMKVINDQALFYINKLTATLEGRVTSLSTRRVCGSGWKSQEGGWAENFPSSKPMVLEHHHTTNLRLVGSLPPSVSGKTRSMSG